MPEMELLLLLPFRIKKELLQKNASQLARFGWGAGSCRVSGLSAMFRP